MAEFYDRSEWGAAPAHSITYFAPLLPNSVTVHAVGAPVGVRDEYLATVKGIQTHAFGKGLSDIDYNYLVDLHGNIYEGRGGDRQSGAQHVGNTTSLAICYLDLGDGDVPFTMAAKRAILNLRDLYAPGGAVHPHRWWNNGGKFDTNCPGDEIAAWCANPVVDDQGDTDMTPEESLRLKAVEEKVNHIEALVKDLATGWTAFRNGWQNDGTATDAQMTSGVQKLRANAYKAANPTP